jgi:hypothetical protein
VVCQAYVRFSGHSVGHLQDKPQQNRTSVVSQLPMKQECHRITVKLCLRTLDNVVKGGGGILKNIESVSFILKAIEYRCLCRILKFLTAAACERLLESVNRI